MYFYRPGWMDRILVLCSIVTNFSHLNLVSISSASAYKLSIGKILKALSTSLRLPWIVGSSIFKYDFLVNLYMMLP